MSLRSELKEQAKAEVMDARSRAMVAITKIADDLQMDTVSLLTSLGKYSDTSVRQLVRSRVSSIEALLLDVYKNQADVQVTETDDVSEKTAD